MTFSWPSRTQWQADAADWARTSVLPTERVPANVDAEVTRRATDEAWLREKRRRERIEQGPVIVHAMAATPAGA